MLIFPLSFSAIFAMFLLWCFYYFVRISKCLLATGRFDHDTLELELVQRRDPKTALVSLSILFGRLDHHRSLGFLGPRFSFSSQSAFEAKIASLSEPSSTKSICSTRVSLQKSTRVTLANGVSNTMSRQELHVCNYGKSTTELHFNSLIQFPHAPKYIKFPCSLRIALIK